MEVYHIFKSNRKYLYVSLVILVAILSSTPVKGQGYDKGYVVIGAFAFKENAQRFTENAKKKNIDVQYEIHPVKDLFYVYEETSNAYRECDRIKGNFPEFNDAWIYRGSLGRDHQDTNRTHADLIEDEHLIRLRYNNDKKPETEETTPVDTKEIQSVPVAREDTIYMEKPDDTDTKTTTVEENTVVRVPKEGTYYVYLNTTNLQNNKKVKGKVTVIDPVRAKRLKNAKSHETVEVRDPKNGSQTIKFSTDIFGYKEMQQTINLENPVNETTDSHVRVRGDSIIVDFELERYKKGDVVVMYNVYFFRDAAIMKSESIYELNKLLEMLMENENLRVRLHGHTNGNSFGKIIDLDDEEKNFFSLKETRKQGIGSAKKLSECRAISIQKWLIEQGVSEERIETKGWGGKKMIYEKDHPQAYKNVRVEVEIVEE